MVTAPSRLRPAAGEATVSDGATRVRRPSPLLAAGLLAALVGGLLFVTVLAGVDDRREVLAIARPVAAGETLSSAHLRTVRVGADTGVTLVPASDRRRMVGRVASVSLMAGSLLVPGQVGSGPAMAAGEAAVGLALESGRYPPGLRPGDRVTVVAAPAGPIASSVEQSLLGTGVIEAVVPAAGGSGVLARLRLAHEAAITIAAEGAAQRVAVVLVAPGEPK